MSRPPRVGCLIAALHCVYQAAEHAFRTGLANDGTGNVTDVAAAARYQKRKAHERREGWTAMSIGKSGDLLGTPDANRAAEHALHVVRYILELGATAGEHDLAAHGAGEAELLEGSFDLVGELLNPLADDHHELSPGELHGL